MYRHQPPYIQTMAAVVCICLDAFIYNTAVQMVVRGCIHVCMSGGRVCTSGDGLVISMDLPDSLSRDYTPDVTILAGEQNVICRVIQRTPMVRLLYAFCYATASIINLTILFRRFSPCSCIELVHCSSLARLCLDLPFSYTRVFVSTNCQWCYIVL